MTHTATLPEADRTVQSPFAFPWQAEWMRRLDAMSIQFNLLVPARVRIVMYALAGGGKILFDAPVGSGTFSELWPCVDTAGRRLMPGVYTLDLELDGEVVGQSSVVRA